MGKSRVKKGASDLETMFPNVSIDWDYEKNELLPSEVAAYSHDSAYWKCHMCGYEWQAQIKSRSSGRGCPACGGQVVIKGQNDLATFFPEIASEWNYEKNGALSPMMFAPYSNEIVWWKCKVCGAEYRKAISGRARGIGCRNCSYKLRGQKLGERMRKRVRNVETGEIFQSLAEAAEKYGESSKNNHIGECCRGQRKTAYGYHWEYAINKE